MGALMVFLKGLMVWVLAGTLTRVLIGAGLALVTFSVLDDLVTGFLGQVSTYVGALPSAVLEILVMMGAGDALSVVGSALLTVATMKAASMVLGVKMS